MTITSYAQNFEDVLLWRALKGVRDGTYVDIGAQDPVVDSISLLFYEFGWRGIHVEPSPQYANALRAARPDETVVEAAIGAKAGALTFYEIPGTGLGTADPEIAARHRLAGFEVVERQVPVMTLDDVLGAGGDREIHWMKIDVEGFERQVIEGWNSLHVRPWIVVVESTLPMSEVETQDSWEPLLIDRGYRFAFFDGLNRYYVSNQHLELLVHFGRPANVFDEFELSGTSTSSFAGKMRREIDAARTQAEWIQGQLSDAQKELTGSRAELRLRLDESQRLASELQVAHDSLTCQGSELALARERLVQAENSLVTLRQQLVGAEETQRQSMQLAQGWRERAIALENSASWRVTKPLRLLKSFLARNRREPSGPSNLRKADTSADRKSLPAKSRLSPRARRIYADFKSALQASRRDG